VSSPKETIPEGGGSGNNEYTVVASGSYEYTYMWQMKQNDGTYANLDYQNMVVLTIGTTDKMKIWNYLDSYQIRCMVKDGCGKTVYSETVWTYHPQDPVEGSN
jgi:hypothetical protein